MFHNQDNKRIAKNSVFLSIRMVLVLILMLYTTRAVLQMLGVEDYGVYNVVCGFVSMFAFLNTSMSNSVQRFYNYEYGKNGAVGASRVYCTSLLIQLLLAIIVIVLTESLGLWYLTHKMVIPDDRMVAAEWIFQFSVLSFLFVIMQAPYTAAVMAHERMDFYAFVSVLDAVLRLGVVFLIPYLTGDKLILYGIFIAMIGLLNFLQYYIYCRRKFAEMRIRNVRERHLFSSMLGFSGWNLFGSLSAVMQTQGINLVINFHFGPVVNAAQGVASQINSGLHSFVANITMPVRPQVVQSYARGDIERTMKLTYSISKLSCCFLMMMGIPISLEIDYVLHLWLGNNVPDHANIFTIIILLTSLTSNLNAAISSVVHATGRMKHYQLWGSLVKISSVPISFLLLTYWHMPELALLTVMVCCSLGHFVCLCVAKHLVPLSLYDYLKNVVLPIILVLLISLLMTFWVPLSMHTSASRFLITVFIGIASVITSLYYVALNKSEKELFCQLAKSVISKIV